MTAIRLLSYNVHSWVGRGRRFDPDAVLAVIADADADLVGLQEVTSGSAEARELLAALPGTPYRECLYGPTLKRTDGHYGNLLLSRWPVESVRRIDLSIAGREPRGAVRATVLHPQIPLDATVTHLGLGPIERRRQAGMLVDHHREVPAGAAVRATALLGDFNEWWLGARLHRRLHSEFGHAPLLRTFPARLPLFPLDRILVRAPELKISWQVLGGPFAAHASDHRPLLTEIRSSDET